MTNYKVETEKAWMKFFKDLEIEFEYKKHTFDLSKGDFKGAFTPSFYLPNVRTTKYASKNKKSERKKGTYLHIGNPTTNKDKANYIKDEFFLEKAMRDKGIYDVIITESNPINYSPKDPINMQGTNRVIKVERKDRPSGVYFEYKSFIIMKCTECNSLMFASQSYEGVTCEDCKNGSYTSRYSNIYKAIENNTYVTEDNCYTRLHIAINEDGMTKHQELEHVVGEMKDVLNHGGYYQYLEIDEGLSELEILKKELEFAHDKLNELTEVLKIENME